MYQPQNSPDFWIKSSTYSVKGRIVNRQIWSLLALQRKFQKAMEVIHLLSLSCCKLHWKNVRNILNPASSRKNIWNKMRRLCICSCHSIEIKIQTDFKTLLSSFCHTTSKDPDLWKKHKLYVYYIWSYVVYLVRLSPVPHWSVTLYHGNHIF